MNRGTKRDICTEEDMGVKHRVIQGTQSVASCPRREKGDREPMAVDDMDWRPILIKVIYLSI